MPLWGNTLLWIDNKPIVNECAVRCGFPYFGQILDSDNQLKKFNEIQEISLGTVTFVQYYGICKAIPFYWKHFKCRCS